MKHTIIFLIKRLEKRFQIDLTYLIKGEFWMASGKFITSITAFLLALAWANWTDAQIYGHYQYILSLVAIISIFALPELGTAIVQAVARGLEGSFIKSFHTQLKWGSLASLAALLLAGYYWFQGNTNLPLAFLAVALFIPFFQAFQMYTSFLQGKRLFGVQVRYSTTIEVLSALTMILTLFLVHRFLNELAIPLIIFLIILIYFSSRTILNGLFWLKTKKEYQPNAKEDNKTISFGKHLTLAGLLGTLANNLDRILLFHYLGAVELAVYSFAIVFPKQINTFLKHIGAMALPKLSVRSTREIKQTFLKKIGYLIILVTVFSLTYIILAPWLYKIFFPQYLDSVPFSRLYALSVIPLTFSLLGSVFRAKMMTKQIFQIRIAIPLLRASLFLFLIPIYGIWGAVLGVLGARTFNALLCLFFFRKI